MPLRKTKTSAAFGVLALLWVAPPTWAQADGDPPSGVVPKQILKRPTHPKPVLKVPKKRVRLDPAKFKYATCVNAAARASRKQPLRFRPNSAELRTESAKPFDKLARQLKACPSSAIIQIEVHSSAIGKDSDNLKLTQDRAAYLKRSLVAFGLAADRIEARGFGETRPIASNKTRAGRAENRRIVFSIASKAKPRPTPSPSHTTKQPPTPHIAIKPTDSRACQLTKRVVNAAATRFQAFKGTPRKKGAGAGPRWHVNRTAPFADRALVGHVPQLGGDTWMYMVDGRRFDDHAAARAEFRETAQTIARCLGWKTTTLGKATAVHPANDPPVGTFAKRPKGPFVRLRLQRYLKSRYKGQTVWVPFTSGTPKPGDRLAVKVTYHAVADKPKR